MKVAYVQYKVMYLEDKLTFYSKESILVFLFKWYVISVYFSVFNIYCSYNEKHYKSTMLWTIHSLLLCYLKYELKIIILDLQTQNS
jgi:hypothetical protein